MKESVRFTNAWICMPHDEAQTPRFRFDRLRPIESAIPQQEPHYWQYCVNCGTQLDSRKCKLVCHKCGFYHSCSEP